jgi:hypothetical protein
VVRRSFDVDQAPALSLPALRRNDERMNVLRKQFGIWGALALLAVALAVPRFRAHQASISAPAEAGALALGALDYARLHLWDQFLKARNEVIPPAQAPTPSLSEYSRYLSSRGLESGGDVMTLYVVGRGPAPPAFDQVQVAYEPDGADVLLHVAMIENGRITPAGTLRVASGSDGLLWCDSRVAETPRLWSFWPIMPQPLLP